MLELTVSALEALTLMHISAVWRKTGNKREAAEKRRKARTFYSFPQTVCYLCGIWRAIINMPYRPAD